jgi:hypothetical protein
LRQPIAVGGRDQIPDIADHKQIARIRRGKKIWDNTAIGACNKQSVGRLPERKPCEPLAVTGPDVLSKFDDSLDELFHESLQSRTKPVTEDYWKVGTIPSGVSVPARARAFYSPPRHRV